MMVELNIDYTPELHNMTLSCKIKLDIIQKKTKSSTSKKTLRTLNHSVVDVSKRFRDIVCFLLLRTCNL